MGEQLHLFKNWEDAEKVREPVLYLATNEGCAVFVPNNLTTITRLRALALIEPMEIVKFEDVLLLRQGEWPGNKVNGFVPTFRVARHAILAGGWDDGDTTERCMRCEHNLECDGPLTTAPVALFDKRDEGGMGAMGDSMIESLNSRCPLYHNGIRVEKKTLTPRILLNHGFEPISSVRAFTDDNVSADDIEVLRTGVQKPGWAADVVSDGWRRRDVKTRWGWTRYESEGSRIDDLFFDERVAVNVLKQRVRGAQANKVRKEMKAYRQEHCARCVYECKKPPWSLDNPRPLTREQIMDEYKPDRLQRRWMELFMVTGHKGYFENPETGRLKYGIGCRPTDELKMRVLGLIPPYGLIDELNPEDYWAQCTMVKSERMHIPSWDMDEDKMTMAHWALRTICELTRWDEARFRLSGERREYFMGRNDILAIGIWPHGSIRIHSDTKASSDGMAWGARGDHIPKEKRPRFYTDYEPFYATCIAHWFNETPGACCGRKIE